MDINTLALSKKYTDKKFKDSGNVSPEQMQNIDSIPQINASLAEITNEVNEHLANHPDGGNKNSIDFKYWEINMYNALGDSITEVNSHTAKRYHEFIQDILGIQTVNNYGISATCIAKKSTSDNTAMCVRYANMNSSADFITVLGGVNDLGFNIPLGTITSTELTTFYGGMKALCSGLIAKYPNKPIIFLTPTKQIDFFASPNTVGCTTKDYTNAMLDVCNAYNIPVYDTQRLSGIEPAINKTQYTRDGLHWNIIAHELVAKLMSEFIINGNNSYNYNSNPAFEGDTNIYGEIVLSKTTTTIIEGGTDTFTVKLDKAPTNNQTVYLSKDNSDVTLSSTSLTFTPSNYNTAQTVTINVADDNTDYSNESCTITLTSPSVSTKTIVVTITDNDTPPVNIPVTEVTLDKTTHTFKVNETVQLVATIQPTDATNKSVTWTSSNTNIATVTNNGFVTAIAEGSATITVTTSDGNKTATCNLTIQANISSFEGKTFTATGKKYAMYHVVALISSNGITNGNVVTTTLRGSNAVNIKNGTDSTGCTLFGDTTGNVSNTGYTNEMSTSATSSLTMSGNTFTTSVSNRTVINSNTQTYLKVPIMIWYDNTFGSFTIDELTVSVNGVKQDILKIGGFFREETFTLT